MFAVFHSICRRYDLLAGGLSLLIATAAAADVEPNNVCSEAEDSGSAATGTVVAATLGENDVDYFRFAAAPGKFFEIRFNAQTPNLDLMAAMFTGDCESVLYFNDDFLGGDPAAGDIDPRFKVRVPTDGIVVLAVTGYGDEDFLGNHFEAGDYEIEVLKGKGLIFSQLSICDPPSEGGRCKITARLDNRTTRDFNGEAWYVMFTGETGGPVGASSRQLDVSEPLIEIPPKGFVRLNHTFTVRSAAPDGTQYCPDLYVATGDPLTKVEAFAFVGCATKGGNDGVEPAAASLSKRALATAQKPTRKER